MLRTILDIALLVIIVLYGWRGWRNGIISGILAICALLVSFYAADILSTTYSQEFTKMLEPFASGLVDKASTEAKKYFEELGVEPDVEAMTRKMLDGIGLMKSAADNVTTAFLEENPTVELGVSLRAAMVKKLCSVAAYVLGYVIAFVLLIVIFAVIGNLVNLAFKLPGLELVNGIVGAVLGLGKGLLLAFSIAWAFRFLGLVVPEATVDSTKILKYLMETCPLTGYLGL